jgi:hypothetical protein
MRPKTSWLRSLVALTLAMTAFASVRGSLVAGARCPSLDSTVSFVDTLWDRDLNEASGIQSSLDHLGVLWIVEDSGNGPWLYAYTVAGRRLATYELFGDGLRNVDWEALGLDHRDGHDWLYVGDIGDNAANRNGSQRPVPALYRFPEPSIDVTVRSPVTGRIRGVTRFPFRYFDSRNHWKLKPRDAESLFVDPRSHDVFVIMKDLTTVDGVRKVARVFRLKNQVLASRRVNHAVHVADPVGAGDGVGSGPVSADIVAGGAWIVVKNYRQGFLWPRGDGRTVPQVLRASPRAPCRVAVDGAEAITFGYRAGRVWTRFLSVRESRGGNPPLHQVGRLSA